MTTTAVEPRTWKDYKSDVAPTWCSGCGDFGVLNAAYRSFAELGLDPEKMGVISGIGCSSRFPYFVNAYGMHTAHGRALPVAAGVKMGNPELEVVVFGGDGDGFSIGGGHVPHIARKNTDITYVMMDNSIYGLTKGQISPTSQKGMVTSTTPYGGPDAPLNPLAYMLTYGATFVAQAYSGKPKILQDLITQAIKHRGFAFINVISPCPTFNKVNTFESYKEKVIDLPENHDTSNLGNAIALALQSKQEGTVLQGVFYKTERPTLLDNLKAIRDAAKADPNFDINKVIDLYLP
jgi:2-oxoglutarate/2-oxoacid ferredoxin oxidoreductase subunit beta